MELRELSITDGIDIFEMLQRIGSAEYGFHNDVNGMTFPQYKTWLIKQHAWSIGEELPAGYVKQWTYWLIDDDGKPVGYGKLREKATKESMKFGGNIGYAIDSKKRGLGYGKQLFKMLLQKSKLLGIQEIFSTVEKYNYPSKKIHEVSGFKLINEDDARWYLYFRNY